MSDQQSRGVQGVLPSEPSDKENTAPVATRAPDDWGESDLHGSGIRVEQAAYVSDQQFFRSVAHYLGVTLVLSCVAATALAAVNLEIPQLLVAVASSILGIFGAMFGLRGR